MTDLVAQTPSGRVATRPPVAPPEDRQPSRHRHLWVLGAFLFYLAFTCFLTWPVITGVGHIFYAQNPPGDPVGAMASYRELVDHHYNPFLPGSVSQFAAPEGQAISWSLNLAAFPGILVQLALTYVFGPIAAYGLYGFMGYILTGMLMFLFVRRLTANPWVALICGWAFAFYPFAVLNGQGHLDYIQGWVLVLAVWRLVELQWLPTRRNAVLAGAAVALAMWWTPYFILLAGATYVAALLGSVVISLRDPAGRAVLRCHWITGAIVAVFLAFLGALATLPSTSSSGVRTNTVAEFFAYSARPLEYLLPDSHSPLLGSVTGPYLASHLHGSDPVEATLYLGVTVLVLALIACIALARRKLPRPAAWAAILLLAIGLVALISSAPPEGTILGVRIPFPSHFVMRITTTWRAYSRFGIIVMLAVTSLAGIGLAAVARWSTPVWRIVVLVAAAILIPLDLWARLPAHTPAISRTDTYSIPNVYKVLARQPRGLTAEYPLVPYGYNFYQDVFYQNVHGMPMINGYLAGTLQERRAVSLANLSDPHTGPRLAALGVRYVIREAGASPYGLPSAGTPRKGFRLIYRDSFARLYAVTARPSGPALPTPDAGFAGDEVAPGGTVANWLEAPSGTIEFAGGCKTCTGTLGMTLWSFARPRTVTISEDGKPLLVRRVFTHVRVSVPISVRSGGTVTIAATPGPQSIQKTIGGSDTRAVSVQVSDVTFVPPPGHGRS